MVTSNDQVANLEAQLSLQESEPVIALVIANESEEDLSLNSMLSNDSEYFDLLFDLLNLGQAEVTEAVWNLLI